MHLFGDAFSGEEAVHEIALRYSSVIMSCCIEPLLNQRVASFEGRKEYTFCASGRQRENSWTRPFGTMKDTRGVPSQCSSRHAFSPPDLARSRLVASLHLVRLEAHEQLLLAVVASTASEALCQCRSESIHLRSVRLGADVPWIGWAVRLERHVRRFFCQNHACIRQIFEES